MTAFAKKRQQNRATKGSAEIILALGRLGYSVCVIEPVVGVKHPRCERSQMLNHARHLFPNA